MWIFDFKLINVINVINDNFASVEGLINAISNKKNNFGSCVLFNINFEDMSSNIKYGQKFL